MKYFAALLIMKDAEKNAEHRQKHVDFLTRQEKEGTIFARGKFTGGEGGMVIYIADSFDKARRLAEGDPYIALGARTLELFEWDMKINGNLK